MATGYFAERTILLELVCRVPTTNKKRQFWWFTGIAVNIDCVFSLTTF